MIHRALQNTAKAIADGTLQTFIPLLSIFTLKTKPLNLKMHYQFAPMFNVRYPDQQIWMTARQVGKTSQLCSSSVIRSSFIPFYDILHIQPRDQQRTRYHSTILKPLLESSIISDTIIKHSQMGKVLLKQFNSGSFMYLGTAYASAGALRGLSGCSQIVVDQLADVSYDFIPIIKEVMSANIRYGYSVYAGTPTTSDTTCGILWDKSSQAQWIIKCTHCNKQNIPNPEQDLQKMIGDKGIICAKCGRQVSPTNGGYVHAFPDRQLTFPGYHIAQPIHPLHLMLDPMTKEPRKWFALLAKIRDYGKLQLYNEVYGWPYDQSINPLTLKDLTAAQFDQTCNSLSQVLNIANNYRCLAIGIDWDGGGLLSQSFTAACIAGLRNDSNRIDILMGKRWGKQTSPTDQADEIMHWVDVIGPDILAHDNAGAGFVRMQILKQKGLLQTSTTPIPYTYTRPGKGDIVKFAKAQRQTDYYNYTLDKSRSLAVLIQAIKDASVRIPKFNIQNKLEPAYDFLALKQQPRMGFGNQPIVIIGKKPGVPDDFAHAVNFACSAIWDRFHIYPVLGRKYDTQALAQQYDNFSPRSQFQDFKQALAMRVDLIQPSNDYY